MRMLLGDMHVDTLLILWTGMVVEAQAHCAKSLPLPLVRGTKIGHAFTVGKIQGG